MTGCGLHDNLCYACPAGEKYVIEAVREFPRQHSALAVWGASSEGLRRTQFPAAIALTSGTIESMKVVPRDYYQHDPQGLWNGETG